jgi:hypothetical protein
MTLNKFLSRPFMLRDCLMELVLRVRIDGGDSRSFTSLGAPSPFLASEGTKSVHFKLLLAALEEAHSTGFDRLVTGDES